MRPFFKIAKDTKAKNPDGNDYFIRPGKVQVGDKKLFATIKDLPGHTYGPGEPSAENIKNEFTAKGYVVKPESNVYTDTTNVQTFRGKQQKVRHIVDGNIMKKHTSNIKNDVVSGSVVSPIKNKATKKLKEDREYYAGHKEHNVPNTTFFDKIKGWFKGGESKTWMHAPGTARASVINKELGLKPGEMATAVTDTLNTPKGKLIWLGSMVPGHPIVKTKTKLVSPTETKARFDFVPKQVIEKVLEGRKETIKMEKASWFQGTSSYVI
jgi:hypothetical protein